MTFADWWRLEGNRLRNEWAFEVAEYAWLAATAECRRRAQQEADKANATASSVASAVATTVVEDVDGFYSCNGR